jgi:hypothetical protein
LIYILGFPEKVDDLMPFIRITSPSLVDTRLHDFGRDVFLWRGSVVVVDDRLRLGGRRNFAGLGLVGGAAVVGDAGVGTALACGSHCCGEVVVGGWRWWR